MVLFGNRLYKKIAKEHEKRYGWDAKSRRIYKQLYDEKTHFIYELIQNADDNKSQCLELQLRENALLAWNNGDPFSEQDVWSICSIGSSNKDLTKIGTFGIGFKAVYNYTELPEVYSGDKRFCIRDYTNPEGIDIPPEVSELVDTGKTVFRLPFKESIRPKEIEQLKGRLRNLEKRALFFLRHVEKICWRDEHNSQVWVYACHRSPYDKIENASVVALSTSMNNENHLWETFLVFSKEVQPPQGVIDELLQLAEDDEEQERIRRSSENLQRVEIAFKLDNDRITETDNCVLFAYFPTQKETHLRFLIQARYQTTPARANIWNDNPWNAWLIKETADYLPNILEQLKDGGLLEPAFFNVLPLKADNVQEPFDPIIDALQKAMQEGALIPTEDGGYAKAENVYYPRAENLRKLVESSELVPNSSWLHPGIGGSGRAFEVMKEAGVREINIRNVLNWLEKQDLRWFKSRCEKWLCSLYIYLGTQKPQLDRIKKLPLVRLENGQHVCASDHLVFFPPDADEDQQKIQPFLKELPILQAALLKGDDRNDIEPFLKKIGVRVLKPEELIEEWILPQYSQTDKPSVLQNRLHVRYIFRVWDELSGYKYRDLKVQISKMPILHAYNGVQPNICAFVKPCDAYLPQAYTGDNNLETYFSGCDRDVWFVDSGYLAGNSEVKDWLQFLKQIGTIDTPRVVKKEVPGNSEECQKRDISRKDSTRPFKNGRFIDYYDRGYYDGVIIDLDFDGLSEILAQIGNLKEANLSRSVWDLLIKMIKPLHSEKWRESERDRFFQGVYRWFHRTERTKSFDATFYHQLKETAWLPDEQGNLHLPAECFAPTNENRKLLGGTVPYLPTDIDISEKNEPARWLAQKLGIHLNANPESVLKYLQTLSGTTVSLDKVESLYHFLRNRSAGQQPEFKEKPLIFTPEPEPHWWKAEEVFWEDETPVFGNHRGYLARHYAETLKPFFTGLDVSERAAPLDYVRGIQEVAAAGQTDEAVHERIKILYSSLWQSLPGGGNWQETDEWQQTREGKCWLGGKGNAYSFFTRHELVWNDHSNIADIFEGKVPFWAFDDLVDLAKNLEIEGCSQAKGKFCPAGDQEEDTDWSEKARQLRPYIRAFLNSPRLCDKAADEVKPIDVLDRISVRLVEELKVTYTLKGISLPNPNPRFSFLDRTEPEATLWLALAADKNEYPELVGDALQYYFDVKELSGFVEDLLTKKCDRVLERWKQKGLDTDLCVSPIKIDVAIDSEETPESIKVDERTGQLTLDLPTAVPPKTESESDEAATDDPDGAHRAHSPDTDVQITDKPSREGMNLGTDESDVTLPIARDGSKVDTDATEPEMDSGDSRKTGSGVSRTGHSGGHWAGPSSGSTYSGSGGHSSRGGGGEGESHRTLKEYLANNPSLFGEKLKLVATEYRFRSGDEADVLFEDGSGNPVTVEVKPPILSGSDQEVWQAVKYQHLAAMEYKLPCAEVRSILAAPRIPDDVKRECKRLGIEPMEVSDQSE